jgi:hypothetical protein
VDRGRRGTVRWTRARPEVSDQRWYSPSGYRVAYLSTGSLRVVGGDGTGDRILATTVADVAPGWRPGLLDGSYELAYVTARGRLVVRDAGTGRILWSSAAGPRPEELMWSTDGGVGAIDWSPDGGWLLVSWRGSLSSSRMTAGRRLGSLRSRDGAARPKRRRDERRERVVM